LGIENTLELFPRGQIMPRLNRRRFMQLTSSAGLAPLLPALPLGAAVPPTSATSAQMLWASLYARAGNASSAAAVAKSMGVSNATAQGIFTKLAHANILTAPGVRALGHVARSGSGMANAPVTTKPVASKSTKINLRKWLTDQPEEEVEVEETDSFDASKASE
jgi:hypothetical protein